MDTLELAFQDAELGERLLSRLRQYGPSQRYRDKNGKVSRGRYGYRKQFYFEPDGKHFYLAFDRWHCSYPEVIVEVQLSKFSTYAEATHWLHVVFGEDAAQIIASRIIRLYLCVDLSVPYETIRTAITQPKARRNEVYGNAKAGTLYLAKQPRQTCVYRKQIQSGLADDPNAHGLSGLIDGTRIEVRLTKSKLPIRTLAEVDRLRELNPFAQLRLNRIDEALLVSLQGNARNLVLAYQRQRDLIGAQAARKEFNQQHNFARTIGKYLGPLAVDLDEAWRRRVERYLGPSVVPAKEEGVTP